MNDNFTFMTLRILIVTGLLSLSAGAEVVRVDVQDRNSVLHGKSFGTSGAYERLKGRVHFEVDPELEANRAITDLQLGPRNQRGRIEFSSDFYVLAPSDPKRENGSVLFEVSNRGNKGMLGMFNLAASSLDPQTEAEFGDGLLLSQGFVLAWLGWQFDVPQDPQLMRLYAPKARNEGHPLQGLVRSEHVPDRRVLSFSLADRTMIAYPVADPHDPDLKLTVRDRRDGPRQTIPRNQWQFAREENGQAIPDLTQVFMASGFTPGKIYELVYKAQDPVLVGLGPAAVRDFIAFLKHGAQQAGTELFRDKRQRLQRAIGFGSSQSGRFLRAFLYQGFNRDEQGRKVFDGVMAHVAGGGRGSFNYRFAQPSRDGHPFMNCFYPTDIFPFADLAAKDPETGLEEGLLVRASQDGVAPRIFYTNSSYEYYGRAASLTHTTPDGRQDMPLRDDTRIYLFAGAQHGPAPFPPSQQRAQQLANPNDFRWSMRALLLAMNAWLAAGKEPPPSRYPRIAIQTLVPLEALKFPRLPGVSLPQRIQTAYRVNFGAEFASKGIVSIEPPQVGTPFVTLVPQANEDGNETSGIRLPDIQIPLATFTGWNLRAPELGAPEELLSMVGSFIPFARTKAERLQKKDPRRSIEERYRGREQYLQRISAAALQLSSEGYLLEADIPRIVATAAARWDYVSAATPILAAPPLR
ncbi:MAG: hypothetical protein FJW26_12145 [Acidimicrobiia bacterium]|nr:hypothetical protein [Acidimicrobiia bacterium]